MIATAAGFMAVCIGLELLTTALLVTKFIDQSVWSSTTVWIWSGQLLGGALKVWADRVATRIGGSNGRTTP